MENIMRAFGEQIPEPEMELQGNADGSNLYLIWSRGPLEVDGTRYAAIHIGLDEDSLGPVTNGRAAEAYSREVGHSFHRLDTEGE